MDKKVEQDTWFIAHNGVIFHQGFSAKGTWITTGMPNVETFLTEKDFDSRISKLKLNKELQPIIKK